eukprot:GHVU01039466.1.p1 GENE.GHVU01039466.1~~GHVU01039466.1.p1  ORF type:complete len:161 (-),score=23.21 GHVU01039466.1:246-728(-)
MSVCESKIKSHMYGCVRVTVPASASTTEPSASSRRCGNQPFSISRFLGPSIVKKRKVSSSDQLDQFLEKIKAEDDQDYVKGEDLLAFWFGKRKEWPQLTSMAKEVLACPPTTAGVERLFSRAGRYRTKHQKRRKETTLETFLYVSSNFPLVDMCERIQEK